MKALTLPEKMGHIGFTGTRKGTTFQQELALENILHLRYFTHAHLGDCTGADSDIFWLVRNEAKTIGHPPFIDKYRAFHEYDEERTPKPYLVRNQDIVNESSTLIAFPGEYKEVQRSGTWATIRYARKQNKEIFIIFPDGSIKYEPPKLDYVEK